MTKLQGSFLGHGDRHASTEGAAPVISPPAPQHQSGQAFNGIQPAADYKAQSPWAQQMSTQTQAQAQAQVPYPLAGNGASPSYPYGNFHS